MAQGSNVAVIKQYLNNFWRDVSIQLGNSLFFDPNDREGRYWFRTNVSRLGRENYRNHAGLSEKLASLGLEYSSTNSFNEDDDSVSFTNTFRAMGLGGPYEDSRFGVILRPDRRILDVTSDVIVHGGNEYAQLLSYVKDVMGKSLNYYELD